jgi:hypothetical protein
VLFFLRDVNMKKLLSIFLGISLISMAMTGNASLLTSDTIVGSTVVDFSTQPTVEDVNGPLQIGMLVGENIEVSSPTGQLYTNYDGWGLGPNGDWESPMTYVSQDENGGTMIFAFMDGPVSAVGGFMSYWGADLQGGLVITALNAGMAVLETYDIVADAPIVTPAVNGGAFRGIDRGGVADIAYFQVTGAYPVLDDLTFTSSANPAAPATPATPIPALSQWALIMLSMLLGLMVFANRKRLL